MNLTRTPISNSQLMSSDVLIKTYKEFDNGRSHYNNPTTGKHSIIEDLDPRDGFVSVKLRDGKITRDAIISPDSDNDHSLTIRSSTTDVLAFTKRWKDENGFDFTLSTVRDSAGKLAAQLCLQSAEGTAEAFDADSETATSLFHQYKQEFEEQWNVAP